MESYWPIILIQAIVFGVFCSFIANEKGRDSGGWFFLGFMFSILAVLALIAIPNQENRPAIVRKRGNDISPSSKAICPFCREEINRGAILCKHCRSDLTEKRPIIIEEQTSAEEDASHKTKIIYCPKCDFSEEVLYSEIASNSAFHKFEAHLDSTWERYLICPKCHKKIAFIPRLIDPD